MKDKMIMPKENMGETLNQGRMAEANVTLGKKLKSSRESLGLSQEELAEKLGVTRQAVSNWERDKNLPDIYTLRQTAGIFGMTLDEFMEDTRREEVRQGKVPGRLAAASVGIIILYLVTGAVAGELQAGPVICMIVIGIMMQMFLHLYFSGAIKTGNFSMLAGYDPKAEYDVREVKRLLVQMDLHISSSSFAAVLMLFLCASAGYSGLGMIQEQEAEIIWITIMAAYILDFIGSIMLYNYRGISRILVQEKDRKAAKAGYVSVIWFLVWVLGCAGILIGKLELKEIENNTVQALQSTGWLLLLLLVLTVELFWEQGRVKKTAAAEERYRPGKAFWAANGAAFILSFLIFFG